MSPFKTTILPAEDDELLELSEELLELTEELLELTEELLDELPPSLLESPHPENVNNAAVKPLSAIADALFVEIIYLLLKI